MKKQYPKLGIPYYHYKGGVYEVLSLAKHTETNEDMVVYKSLLFGSIYVRPLSMWFDDVDTQVKIPNFGKGEYEEVPGRKPRFSEDPNTYK
jgi:hypothetical protein